MTPPDAARSSRARVYRTPSREDTAARFRTIREGTALVEEILLDLELEAELLPFAESVRTIFELRDVRKALSRARARIHRTQIETLEGGA